MKNVIISLLIPIFIALLANLQPLNAQPWTNPAANQPVVLDATHTGSSVGIGTSSPSQRLHLSSGNMLLDYSNGAATTGNIFFGSPTFGTGSTTKAMRLSYYNGTAGSTLGGYLDVRVPALNNDGLIFRVDATNGGTERMRIGANGNVGINASNPVAKLEVKTGSICSTNPLTSNDGVIFRNSAGTAGFADWGIQYWQNTVHPNEPAGLNFWKPFGATTGAFANYVLYLQDDGKVKMGEVGTTVTGQANNNFRLFVKDGIVTEKLLISTFGAGGWNWPDYVFAPDHKLRSLEEVEAFVKKEKHLPNVPSAAEVNQNGIEIAQMNATLLEKVEELTLYLVDLNKRVKALEAENAALKTNTPTPSTTSTSATSTNTSTNAKQ